MRKINVPTKECPVCGMVFEPSRAFQKYCSKDCRYTNYLRVRSKEYYREKSECIKNRVKQWYRSRNFGIAFCQQCEKKFDAWIPSQKFCSKDCQQKHWIERGKVTRFKGDKRNRELSREGRMKQIFPKSHTWIERALQDALRNNGLKFETNYPILGVCQADIAFPQYKVAVFCDGDYWHRLPSYIVRDKKINKALKRNGWHTLRFWEFEIKTNLHTCAECIKEVIV